MCLKITHSATISGIFRHFEAIFTTIIAILCPKFIAKNYRLRGGMCPKIAHSATISGISCTHFSKNNLFKSHIINM